MDKDELSKLNFLRYTTAIEFLSANGLSVADGLSIVEKELERLKKT